MDVELGALQPLGVAPTMQHAAGSTRGYVCSLSLMELGRPHAHALISADVNSKDQYLCPGRGRQAWSVAVARGGAGRSRRSAARGRPDAHVRPEVRALTWPLLVSIHVLVLLCALVNRKIFISPQTGRAQLPKYVTFPNICSESSETSSEHYFRAAVWSSIG
jgi:hypothetical protein